MKSDLWNKRKRELLELERFYYDAVAKMVSRPAANPSFVHDQITGAMLARKKEKMK